MSKSLFLSILLCIFLPYTLTSQKKALNNVLKKHVEILASDSLEGRGLGTEGKIKAVNYIEKHFTEAGISSINGSFKHQFEMMIDLARVKGTNIIGKIEGSHPTLKDEYIVLGAHYDHIGWEDNDDEKEIYNGADDNASGTATIIELAKSLANKKLKRSVLLIAFDAEESGLLGSENFLNDKLINADQIKVMFSIDMVGMYSTHGGVDLVGLDLLEDGSALLNMTNTSGTIVKKTGTKKEYRTDTKSFLDYNIPSIHVFTGLKSPYHQPEDTAEKLDYDGMASICSLLSDFTIKLANEDELIPNQVLQKTFKADPTIAVGIKLGFGSSYLNFKDHDIRGKKSLAFETGLQTRIKLSHSLFLATDFLYEYSKGKIDEGSIQLHSLTVPVQLMLKTAYNNEYSPRLFISAGMFFSSHFADQVSGTHFNPGRLYNDNGICFGFGMEFKKINLSYDWRISRTGVFELSDHTDILRNGSKLSFGYRF